MPLVKITKVTEPPSINFHIYYIHTYWCT